MELDDLFMCLVMAVVLQHMIVLIARICRGSNYFCQTVQENGSMSQAAVPYFSLLWVYNCSQGLLWRRQRAVCWGVYTVFCFCFFVKNSSIFVYTRIVIWYMLLRVFILLRGYVLDYVSLCCGVVIRCLETSNGHWTLLIMTLRSTVQQTASGVVLAVIFV